MRIDLGWAEVWPALRRGLVIPAHPLALTAQRRLDERRQRALTRYYLAAGAEVGLAADYGYHAALVSLGALAQADEDTLIAHCTEVARILPLFGFYLQPAAGGRLLSRAFWQRFAAIDNVVAIKVAPFNRYHTLDVVRAVAEAGRAGEIALYTGNDDHIVGDLLETYCLA